MSLSVESWRYNADGLLLVSKETAEKLRSYLQVFRDGSLEYGDFYVLQEAGTGSIPSAILEQKIVSTFQQALSLLKLLEIPDPVYVTLTLVGMKGRILATPYNRGRLRYESDPFDRDVILCPDIQIQNTGEGDPYPTTLQPIVNSIWQAAGFDQSPYIQNGKWTLHR